MKSNVPLAARRDRIVNSCRKNLEQRHKRVLVGLSGGADSCALLGCLCVLRDRGDLDEVSAIHVCHNMRDNCEIDASFSQKISAELGCKFVREDIYPKGMTGNSYDVCRNLRYSKMVQHCRDQGITALAVAHHLNDQLETMIFRISRGAVPNSICGMDFSSQIYGDVSLVRPLLEVTRKDCERMCSKMGVMWIDDPSNANTDRTRAFIRHEIVPLLRKLNPRIEQSIGRISRTMRKELRGNTHGFAKEKEQGRNIEQ